MRSDEIQLLNRLFKKLATRSDNNFLKSILSAALVMSDKKSGIELKDVARKLIERL